MNKTMFALLLLSLALPAHAQRSVDGGEQLLPRGFTAEELTRKAEVGTYVKPTAAPPAGTRNPAEYEPMTGVLVRWPLGVPYNLLDSIANHIKLWMVVASSQQAACQSGLSANGVNMANVGYVIATTNSIWTRDYGPWFVIEPDGRQGIFNFAYNRPRPLDDSVPIKLGAAWNLPVYSSVLVHTGGNYMSGGYGQSMSTTLVYDENDSSASWVDGQMLQYLGVDDYVTMGDPQASYINHIDCWAKILSPTKVLVLQVPPSNADYDSLEAAAAYLATQTNHYGTHWEVVRVYSGGTEGYTNSVILNDYVYVPVWNTANDAAALQAYRDALPGYHIVGNYYGGSSGYLSTDAIHCRTMGVTDSAMLWIDHIPVAARQPAGQPVTIASLIRCYPGFALTSHRCCYRFGTSGGFDSLDLGAAGSDSFAAQIPGAPAGDTVEYYISATDNSGRAERQPRFAPATWCHRYVAVAAGVSQRPAAVAAPAIGQLKAAPNPSRGVMMLTYRTTAAGMGDLAVYNIGGQRVRTLAQGMMAAGDHTVSWDGRDSHGRPAPCGVYLLRLASGGTILHAKIIRLK